MSSRFIHVGSGVRLSFLSKIPLSVSITFVYSFIHWWFLTDPVSTLVAEWQISSCGIPSTSTSWPSALFLFFTIHLSIYHCYKLMNPTLEWFLIRSSLVAQTVKHLSTMRETWVRSLGWEDSLEKEMATHSVLVPWKSYGWRSLVQATVHGVTKSRARLSDFTSLHKENQLYRNTVTKMLGNKFVV